MFPFPSFPFPCAIRQALGDKKAIRRYGSFLLPMDEALVLCAVDLSGRSCLAYTVDLLCDKVGDFDTELVEEFLRGFVRRSEITLHIRTVTGTNTHHIIEAIFKGFARALAEAVAMDPRVHGVMSSKGSL